MLNQLFPALEANFWKSLVDISSEVTHLSYLITTETNRFCFSQVTGLFFCPTKHATLLESTWQVKKCHMFVEAVCAQQTKVEMSLSFGFTQAYFRADLLPILIKMSTRLIDICLDDLSLKLSVQQLPRVKAPLNRSVTDRKAGEAVVRLPGTVNVAPEDKLRPNTGRAPASSEIPGFHHTPQRILSVCSSLLRRVAGQKRNL